MRKRQPLPPPEAFIFDLDGTLTIPQLDFEGSRKEMGIAAGPILEELELLDDEAAARARGLRVTPPRVLVPLLPAYGQQKILLAPFPDRFLVPLLSALTAPLHRSHSGGARGHRT